MPDDPTGLEATQLQRVEIELGLRLRVRGQQHLEPTIEVEPVNNIGADAPPDVVGCFDDHDIAPGRVEHSGGRQTGKPGTDDHDLGVLG